MQLGQYAQAFKDNAIDWDVLPDVDQEVLKDIGVKAAGDRLRIVRAIAALENQEADTLAVSSRSSPASSLQSLSDLTAWSRTPGERKPVTMLFADITGSTALTENLDAEEAHESLYGATQAMCEAIENNRGTVCRFMGDGVMAMFGAPVATERHAVDACQAALDMQKAINRYARDSEALVGLKIRVGLHSGEVVVLTVGEGDKAEYDASGPTVPIAGRMEQAAVPGEIHLTAATRALAQERIEAEELEPVSVKGISTPINVYALRGVKPAEDLSAVSPRTAFVGRRAELNQFRGMLETCLQDGIGQTVYIRGEPGIGKTRLVGEFSRLAEAKDVTVHRALVLPFGVGKGHDASRALLRNLLGLDPRSNEEAMGLAADKAIDSGLVGGDDRVFLNDLLDLAQPTDLQVLYDAMDNTTRNEGKRSVISNLIAQTSQRGPLLVIIEDVH